MERDPPISPIFPRGHRFPRGSGIITIVIPTDPPRERKVSYLPCDVTEPQPLFFISWRYKRNALLISRLLAIPSARDSSYGGLLPLDQYRMIRMKHFINSRQFHIVKRFINSGQFHISRQSVILDAPNVWRSYFVKRK